MSALRRSALAALAAACASAAPLAGQVAPRPQVEVLALSPEPGERIAEDQVMVAVAALVRNAACYQGTHGDGLMVDTLRDLVQLDDVGQEARA